MSNTLSSLKEPGLTLRLREALGLTTGLPFPEAKKATKGNEAAPFRLPTSSALGTPRYFAIKLAEVTLPNEPLITVSGSKTIVKAQIAHSDFTVKEIIGLNDWQINIKGFAVREGVVRDRPANTLVPEDYPEEWLRQLVSLYNRNYPLRCECQLLSYFNITGLVIESISFPPIAGAHGYFAYEINATSDQAFTAKLGKVRER